jgi:NAD(P)-dependent dehydrogenase (short-subunit alcohol dehydrogenase family)
MGNRGESLGHSVYCIEAFLPHIKAHGDGGHIVNTAAFVAIAGPAGIGPSNAANAAKTNLSETLAAELAGCRAQKIDMLLSKLINVVQSAEHRFRDDLSASFLRQRHRRTAWSSLSKRAVRSPPI